MLEQIPKTLFPINYIFGAYSLSLLSPSKMDGDTSPPPHVPYWKEFLTANTKLFKMLSKVGRER
jgi:hypothetical protein